MPLTKDSRRIALSNILFLTDFSGASASALPFAARIGRTYGAKLTALHVVVPTVSTYMPGEMSASAIEGLEDFAREEMKTVEQQLVGQPGETIVERGNGVWEVVHEVSRDREIDLIVLGTHGRTGARKMLMGSFAEEIFRQATSPVLTVGPAVPAAVDGGGRFERVLFATDFSTASVASAPYALSLAQENQAQLVLLHVLRMPKPGKSGNESELSIAEALHRLVELVPRDAELWCRPEPLVTHGRPAAGILEAAQNCRADLIVMGVRSVNAGVKLATHMERATAYEVIAHAKCPVLTVRA